MRKCPCFNCAYRELNCHANCKNPEYTYEQWKSDNSKVKDAQVKDCAYEEYVCQKIRRHYSSRKSANIYRGGKDK